MAFQSLLGRMPLNSPVRNGHSDELDTAALAATSNLKAVYPPVTHKAERENETKTNNENNSHWATTLGFRIYVIADVLKQVVRRQNAMNHTIPTSLAGWLTKFFTYPMLFYDDNFFTKFLLVFMEGSTAVGLYATEHVSEASLELEKADKQGVKLNKAPVPMGMPSMRYWLNGDYVKRNLLGRATKEDNRHSREFINYIGHDFKRAIGYSGEFLQATGQIIGEAGKKLVNPKRHRIKVPELFDIWVTKKACDKNLDRVMNNYKLGVGNLMISLGLMVGAGLSHAAGLKAISEKVFLPLMFLPKSVEIVCAFGRSKTMSTLDEKNPYGKLMAGGHAARTVMMYTGLAGWQTSWMMGLTKLGDVLNAPWSTYRQLSKVNKANTIEKFSLNDISDFAKVVIGIDWLQTSFNLAAGGLIIAAPLIKKSEEENQASWKPWSPDFIMIKNYERKVDRESQNIIRPELSPAQT